MLLAVAPAAPAVERLVSSLLPLGDRAAIQRAAFLRQSADALVAAPLDIVPGATLTHDETALALLSGRSCLNMACTCLERPTEASMKTEVWGMAGGLVFY